MQNRHLLALIAGCWLVAAASAEFTIRWHSMDSGGATFISTSSCFRLSGTIGQPDAAGPVASVPKRVRGGFWADVLVAGIQVGDVNCDGDINNFDIDPFVIAIVDPAAYSDAYPDCDILRADINRDGAIDNFDIDAFVRLVICE